MRTVRYRSLAAPNPAPEATARAAAPDERAGPDLAHSWPTRLFCHRDVRRDVARARADRDTAAGDARRPAPHPQATRHG